METRNRLTETRGEAAGGIGGKGSNGQAGIKDPWTWTTRWGLTAGVGGWWSRGEQWGKLGHL